MNQAIKFEIHKFYDGKEVINSCDDTVLSITSLTDNTVKLTKESEDYIRNLYHGDKLELDDYTVSVNKLTLKGTINIFLKLKIQEDKLKLDEPPTKLEVISAILFSSGGISANESIHKAKILLQSIYNSKK